MKKADNKRRARESAVWLVVLRSEIIGTLPTFSEARAFQKGLRSQETLIFRARVVCEGDGTDIRNGRGVTQTVTRIKIGSSLAAKSSDG